MKSLALSTEQNNWDLMLDAEGNIATVSGSLSVAQDVACAIKVFLGEVYFDTTIGVPYFEAVLGQSPSVQLLQSLILAQVLSVAGVVSTPAPKVTVTSYSDRKIAGRVSFTDTTGKLHNISF
jgi:hypothetical protein